MQSGAKKPSRRENTYCAKNHWLSTPKIFMNLLRYEINRSERSAKPLWFIPIHSGLGQNLLCRAKNSVVYRLFKVFSVTITVTLKTYATNSAGAVAACGT